MLAWEKWGWVGGVSRGSGKGGGSLGVSCLNLGLDCRIGVHTAILGKVRWHCRKSPPHLRLPSGGGNVPLSSVVVKEDLAWLGPIL